MERTPLPSPLPSPLPPPPSLPAHSTPLTPAPRGPRTATTLAVIASVAALYFAAEVLIPVAVAILLAFVLAPAVRRLELWRVPRPGAVFSVMGGFVLLLAGIGWVLQGQAVQLAGDLPRYKSSISAKLAGLRGESTRAIDRASTTIAEIGREIARPRPEEPAPGEHGGGGSAPAPPAEPQPVRIVDATTSPLASATAVLGPVASRIATGAIVVVLTAFILFRREDIRNRIVRLMGTESIHQTTPAIDDAARRVSRYLWLQLVVNTGAGVTVGLGLAALGVPGAFLWGGLMIALRFIPYVGAWVAAAFPVLVSLAVAPDWHQPVMVAAFIGGVELLCGQVVEPLLFSAGVGLSSIAVLLSAIFWGWLWGPVGLLLSTPIAVCLVVMGKHFPRLAFLDVLLGERIPLPPDARLYQRLLAGDPEEASRIVEEFRRTQPTMVRVYDGLLIPTLRLAETARHRGELGADQERAVRELVAMLVEDIGPGDTSPPASPSTPGNAPAVLCIPARDAADAAAARMLEQVICAGGGAGGPGGAACATLSTDVLTGELIELIRQRAEPPLAVCISVVPPDGAMHARVIAKRLRSRFPQLPVIVGIWSGEEHADDARRTLGQAATPHIVTTLEQAAATVIALTGGAGGAGERGGAPAAA